MRIQRLVLPNSFGSSPILPWTLVASTTCSRRPPASALPTIVSDSPREYTSAVSMKLMPASSARWMMRIDSSWSVSPHAPNIIAPRQSGLTLTPVRPRLLFSIGRPYSCGAAAPQRSAQQAEPLCSEALLVVVVQRIDLVREVLVDLLALQLQRRRQLVLVLRQLAIQDVELLDLLDLGQVVVGLVDRLLDFVLAGAVVGLDQRDQVGPVVAIDHGLRHRRVLLDLLLDVRRRDVLAARRDDDLLGAAGDRDEAVVVDRGQVAGLEPLAVERVLRLVLEVVVALEHVRALDEQLGAPLVVGVVRELRLGALDGLADGPELEVVGPVGGSHG